MDGNANEVLRRHAHRHDPTRLADALAALTPHDDTVAASIADSLNDGNAEVRVLALEVLRELGPKAESVLPAMIRALEDKDRIVRICALEPVASFGPKAQPAVPILQKWLSSEDDFSRVSAAGHVVMIDPSMTTEMMPFIEEALSSESGVIRRQAQWLLDEFAIASAKGTSE